MSHCTKKVALADSSVINVSAAGTGKERMSQNMHFVVQEETNRSLIWLFVNFKYLN